MLRLIVLAFCVLVFPVSAQTVQKCVGRNGQVTLTSGLCPEGQTEAARYEATPERVTSEQQRRQAELRQWEREQQARRSATSAPFYRQVSSSAQQSRYQRCEGAKRWRDAQIERVGLRRTHDMLRSWDGYVYQQCK